MNMFRFASRFLIAFALAIPAAQAQTPQTYNTVASIAALKAMTNRPQVVEVVDANPGIFNLSQGACSAADDVFQVQPTSGTTVCYTRMATPYAVGKTGTLPSGISVPFTQNGTGAATSTIDAKLKQQCVALQDFTGYDPTPGHDNATAFMAAYNAAGTLGYNCMTLPGVQFDMSGVTLSAYNNFTVYCQTPATHAGGGTKIRALTTSTTTITVDTVGGFWFDGCTWTSTSQQVSGSFVKFINTNTSGFTTYYGMYGGYDPLYLENTGGMQFTGSGSIRNWDHVGVTIDGAQDHYFSNLIMDQDYDRSAATPVACFYTPQHGGSLTIVNSDLLHCGHGLWANPGTGQFVNWIYLTNVFFDTCDFVTNPRGSHGINLTATGGGQINGLQMTNVWTATCENGVNAVADSSSFIDGLVITNHQALNNYKSAFRGNNVRNVSITNPLYAGNSQETPHAYSAVYINGANTGSVSVMGGRIGAPMQNYTDTQAFGVQADSGTITVMNVNLNGNNIGPYAFGAVNTDSYVLGSPGATNHGEPLAATGSGPFALSVSPAFTGTVGAADITATGTVRANTGFSANGTAGVSATKTVRDAAGTGTCTLIFTFGLLTGGTC